MSETRPAHSPLGASSAERWMNCPGSVELLKHLQLPETDEPDYRRDGTAAHEMAAYCLRQGFEAWECLGQRFNGVEATLEITDGVQVYLDECRKWGEMPTGCDRASLVATAIGSWYIEHMVSSPIHPQFYGTVDFALVSGTTLHMRDYKNGAGIVVEAYRNPQLMYYVFGLLRINPHVRHVDMGIVQPNAFHPDGPIRIWETDASEILEWGHKVLLPAMQAVEIDHALDTGLWCRFCPAKLVCPAMDALANAAQNADVKGVVNLTDDRLGSDYRRLQALKFYVKAVEDETFRRLNTGTEIPGTKLVLKRANRVWKDQSESVFSVKFGSKAFTQPELKSPSEMEKIDEAAKALVKEWAYTPQAGLTVALAEDKRQEIKVQKTSEAFAKALDNIQGAGVTE